MAVSRVLSHKSFDGNFWVIRGSGRPNSSKRTGSDSHCERLDALQSLPPVPVCCDASPADLALGQIREPALHSVDPRGTRRREVQVQPVVGRRGLVLPVILQHQVDLEARRHCRANDVPELAGPDRPMPRVVQRGEQRGRAVPPVIVHPAFRQPGRIGRSGWLRTEA